MFNLKKILAVFVVLSAAGCFFSHPPSDESMEDKFRSNEAAFRRLVVMIREDINLAGVDLNAAYLPSKEIGVRPEAEIPAKRVEEYHRLLKQTGVTEMTNAGDKIAFLAWQSREIDPTGSGYKNYLYTETLPSPLLDSLDDTSKLQKAAGENSGYKKIAEN